MNVLILETAEAKTIGFNTCHRLFVLEKSLSRKRLPVYFSRWFKFFFQETVAILYVFKADNSISLGDSYSFLKVLLRLVQPL